MKGKIGWAALIAVFIAVAFLPGVFAQQTAIESSVAVEAREQAAAEAGMLGGMDLGALIGGGLGGLLSALGGGAGGLLGGLGGGIGGLLGGLGSIFASVLLACASLPLVGPIFAWVATQFLGVIAPLEFAAAGVAFDPVMSFGGLFFEDFGDLFAIPALCCGFTCMHDPISSILAFCAGSCLDVWGIADLIGAALAFDPISSIAALIGGIVAAVWGFVDLVGAAIVTAVAALINICSLGIAAIPGTICGGLIEACLTTWPCLWCGGLCLISGACIGCLNLIPLDIVGDLAGALGILASCCPGIPAIALAFDPISSFCAMLGGDLLSIWGVLDAVCAAFAFDPISSIAALCTGVGLQMWGILDTISAWLVFPLSCIGPFFDWCPGTALWPIADLLGALGLCADGCLKLPCLMV